MRVLIIEDLPEKKIAVESEIRSFFSDSALEIAAVRSLALASKVIYEQKYDLIIVDLMVPLREGDEDLEDISEEIISILALSDLNRGSPTIALSGFEELAGTKRERFSDAGIVLVYYDEETNNWRKSLCAAMARIQNQTLFDFVVVCALEKERNAFRSTRGTIGELRNIRGLDCLPIEVSEMRGICIKLPRMGLVDASIVTSRAIELFKPKIVAMSGICAGVAGESKIGNLVVADPCWEYQAGKWADDKFKIEHYDYCLDANTKTTISQFIDRIGIGMDYKKDLLEEALVFEKIVFGAMGTGSAVIASAERLAQIKEGHRKLAAIDMEMYGALKASQLSAINPLSFGAKTVVDMADNAKGDLYHEYGCILSARFVLDAIVELRNSSAKRPGQ